MIHSIKPTTEEMLKKNISKYITGAYKFDVSPSEALKNEIYSTFYENVQNLIDSPISEIQNIVRISIQELQNFFLINNKYFSEIELLQYIDNKIILNDKDKDKSNIYKLLTKPNVLSNLLFLLSPEELSKTEELSKQKFIKYSIAAEQQKSKFFFTKSKNTKIFKLIMNFENLNPAFIKDFEILFPKIKKMVDIVEPNMTEKDKINFYFEFLRTSKSFDFKDVEQLKRIKEYIKNNNNNISENLDKRFKFSSRDFNFNFMSRSIKENQELLENYPEQCRKILESFYYGRNNNTQDSVIKDEIEYFFTNLYDPLYFKGETIQDFYIESILEKYKLSEEVTYNIINKYLTKDTNSPYGLRTSLLKLAPKILKDNKHLLELFLLQIEKFDFNSYFDREKINTFLFLIDKCKELNIYEDNKSIINSFLSKYKIYNTKDILTIDKIKELSIYSLYRELSNIKMHDEYFHVINEEIKKKKEIYLPSTEIEYKELKNKLKDGKYLIALFERSNVYMSKANENVFTKKLFSSDIYMLAVLNKTGQFYEKNEYLFKFLKELKLTEAQLRDFIPVLYNCFKNLPMENKIEILKINELLPKKEKLNIHFTNMIIDSFQNRELKIQYTISNKIKIIDMENLSKDEINTLIDNNIDINILDETTIKNIIELYINDSNKQGEWRSQRTHSIAAEQQRSRPYSGVEKYRDLIKQILHREKNSSNTFNQIIFDYKIEKDILINLPKLVDYEEDWLIYNIKDYEYALELYSENLISVRLLFLILKNIEKSSDKKTISDSNNILINALNEAPTEENFLITLDFIKEFKSNDIKNIDLLNIVVQTLSEDNLHKIRELSEYFTFDDFEDKDLLNQFSDKIIFSDKKVSIILKNFNNLLDNKRLIKNNNKYDYLDKLISQEIIPYEETLYILSKYSYVNVIFKTLEPEVQKILDDIIIESNSIKLMIFIISFVNDNYNVFDFVKYNKLMDLYNKNTDPKNHNKNLSIDDYKYIEDNISNKFLQYSFIYKRIFLTDKVVIINANKDLKDVDLFAFFNTIKTLNLKFEDISIDDLKTFELLAEKFSYKEIMPLIKIYSVYKFPLYNLHYLENTLLNDKFINNYKFVLELLHLMKFDLLKNKYPDEERKIQQILISTINNIVENIDNIKVKFDWLKTLKNEQIIRYVNTMDNNLNYNDNFNLALKYISRDKIGNDNESLLDALTSQPITANYVNGYFRIAETLKDTSLLPKNNLPLYKGIVENNNEILIYEYVNTAKIGDSISIDNYKALMSHEPLDCCLTYGGAASNILTYASQNPANCGFFIVSKVTSNISIDVLNDLKSRLKLYNENKLSLKEQDSLSVLIMEHSMIVGASFTYLKGNTLVFDNIETTHKSFVKDENGNNVRYNCATVPFMKGYVEYSKYAMDKNENISYISIGHGYLESKFKEQVFNGIKDELEEITGYKLLQKLHNKPETISGIYTDAGTQTILLDRKDIENKKENKNKKNLSLL